MVNLGRARDVWTGLALVSLLLAVAVMAPEPTPLGAARLAALAIAVAGAGLLVSRVGAADLATAAAAAGGAYLGGVGTALLGWPVIVGIPIGAAAGALVGAASGALHGRVGRILGALTSLALAGGVVAAIGAWDAGGGVAGFHAVRLIARGGARVELAVIAVVLLVALAGARWVASSRMAASAAIAVRAPVLAASLGRRPALDSAVVGAAAGGLLGAGGTVLASVDGSVVPAAYGLQFAAALALAAMLGGAPPLGAIVGTLLVWGPATLWPLIPLVGTAPPLLVAGPVGLVLLAIRKGRPLVAPPRPVDPRPIASPAPRPPARPCTLEVRGAATPSGPIDLVVRPGEVLALAGPNGAGKSTLLARIAGQLPDEGTVDLDGRRAPHGPVARARAGIRRTWQRPPEVDPADLAELTSDDHSSLAAASWARTVMDDGADGGDGPSEPAEGADAALQQLLLLVASGPSVALLDEPTDVDARRLADLLRGLADAGTGVLIVDHRPEVLAAADRVVMVGAEAST